MPYCNVWAKVVFPKSKVFTKTLMPARHQPKSISRPSFMCGCTPVSEIREFNQKKKMNNSEKVDLTLPIFKKNPIVTMM